MPSAAEIFTQMDERIKANADKAKSDVNATYKFVLEGDGGGTYLVNMKDDLGAKEGDGAADCTITVAAPDFLGMIDGSVNGQMLFMSGKLKVAGDMSLAMKLQQVFEAFGK